MIVEDFEAGEGCQFARHSQFPDAGQTMEEDKFQALKSYLD
jgi:hypothetical protein